MRKGFSFAVTFVLGLGGALACSASTGEDVASASQPLTSGEVLGFESVSGWSTTAGSLSSSTTHVQGSYALSVSNLAGNAQLTSATLSTLSGVSSTVGVSIRLPTSQPNPHWLGNVQLAVDAPSRGIHSAFIGQQDLTGLPLGSFQRLSFTVPPAVVSALSSGSYSDLRFILTLNFPSSGSYLLDDLSFGAPAGSDRGTNSRKVHVVYLIPSDKALNPTYVANLETGVRHLQGFYSSKLAGRTFTLTDPIVTVLQSAKSTAWFQTGSFHGNIIAQTSLLAGVDTLNDPNDRWLVYIDAPSPCNNGTGASGSVATHPVQDLQGLSQLPVYDSCSGNQDFSGRCRWVGGMGHELGHTLGLPHPAGCEDSDPATACPNEALMWIGYTTYPNAVFTAADQVTLNANPVLQVENISSFPADCSVVED